jgi:hypothetical protein
MQVGVVRGAIDKRDPQQQVTHSAYGNNALGHNMSDGRFYVRGRSVLEIGVGCINSSPPSVHLDNPSPIQDKLHGTTGSIGCT